MLWFDSETRSECDLPRRGAYNYADEPSTEILCIAYAFDDEPVRIWHPGDPPIDPGAHLIAAHNAQFDRLMWNGPGVRRYGFRPTPVEQWYCTAAQARMRGYPGGLEDLGRAMRLVKGKDHKGKALIRRMSIPPYEWSEELQKQMDRYCLRDVQVMRECTRRTALMSRLEHARYVRNEQINDRGVAVDLELAAAAVRYAAQETEEIRRRLAELTGGAVTAPRQFARLKAWLGDVPEVEKYDRRTGETLRRKSLDKTARSILLDELPEGSVEREVVELVDEAGRSSVSKYQSMIDRASSDGRVRGAYVYCGAGQTGRYSSWGLQMHNFMRVTPPEAVLVRKQILSRKLEGSVMTPLAQMLRCALRGDPLVWGDWSGIEARILPWLAYCAPREEFGDEVAAGMLAMHEELAQAGARLEKIRAGVDLYLEAAEQFGGTRQEGKVAELSLGYQGGRRALQSMGRNYGVNLSDTQAEGIKAAWRNANRWCVDFWARMEQAALAAMYDGIGHAGRIRYESVGDLLLCYLPSGRALCYPCARVEHGPYGDVLTAIKGSWKPAKDEKEWPRVQLYGGLLAENATQAVAADLLNHALDLLADEPVIGHTHDEIIGDGIDPTVLARAMRTLPPWADGLPLEMPGVETGDHYEKR